jgi:hypothetical protein
MTGVQRSIRRARTIRVVAVPAAALGAPLLAVTLIAGSPLVPVLAPAQAVCIVTLLVLIVAQTRQLGTLRRRERELSRPRMTPEDYQQLREMELELGWEPSEVPEAAPATPPRMNGRPKPPCRKSDLSVSGPHGPHGYWSRHYVFWRECPGWEPSEPPLTAPEPSPVLALPPAVILPVTGMTAMADFEAGVARFSATLSGTGSLSAAAGTCTCPPDACAPVGVRTYVPGGMVIRYCSACGKRIPPLEDERPSSAPMTGPGGRWRPVSELPERDARVTEHDAMLAAEGRESCIVPLVLPDLRGAGCRVGDHAEVDRMGAAAMSTDDDTPIGLNCPDCGELPRFVMDGGKQAFCGNTDSCRVLVWDPTMTRAEMLAEGIHEIDLRGEQQ